MRELWDGIWIVLSALWKLLVSWLPYFIAILLLFTIIGAVAGCGEEHKLHNGKVFQSYYQPAYDSHETVCDFHYSGTCMASHQVTHHHEARYFITVSGCFESEHKGCRHEDFELTEDAWRNTPVGSKWSDGSGKANES